MKKIALFLCSIFLPIISFAQNFEFEVFRTAESPGFFGIRLFPGRELSPLEIKDVFVINFKESEEAYLKLTAMLENFGLSFINKDEINEYKLKKNTRLIILGEPIDGFLNFRLNSEEYILKDFEEFALEHLGPIYFQDVRIQFGGNISEVIPSQTDYWGGQELLLVGKFEKPMRTYTEIVGVSREGEIMASAVLDLRTFYDVPIAYELPNIWEERLTGEKKENYNLFWLSVFSWLLGGGGVLLLIFIFFLQRKKRIPRQGLLEDHDFIHLDESLPFEIEPKRKKEDYSSF